MKLVGYILAGLGLVLIALSKMIIAKLTFLKELYVILAGFVLVAIGIVFLLSNSSSSNVKHASEEVPIYQGTGKNRKIVGYQKAK